MSKFSDEDLNHAYARHADDGGPVPAHDAERAPLPAYDHLKPVKFGTGLPMTGETVKPVHNFRELGGGGRTRYAPEVPAAPFVDPIIAETKARIEDAKEQLALRAGVGLKFDTGKAPVRQGVLEYFPRALLEIAKVSEFGARKYAWDNWKKAMPDGINRVGNAGARHILGAVLDKGGLDVETGLLHAAQEAWNCLARLELLLEERENEKATS